MKHIFGFTLFLLKRIAPTLLALLGIVAFIVVVTVYPKYGAIAFFLGAVVCVIGWLTIEMRTAWKAYVKERGLM